VVELPAIEHPKAVVKDVAGTACHHYHVIVFGDAIHIDARLAQ